MICHINQSKTWISLQSDVNETQISFAALPVFFCVKVCLVTKFLTSWYRHKGNFVTLVGTDLQHELQLLKDAMTREFGSLGRQVIHNPDEFEAFCIQSGATYIFSNMVSSVCNGRQSTTCHQRNKKSVVAIIYSLVFTLSQTCNFMQQENTLFMITNNLNKDAINTERSLASACSSRTWNRILQKITLFPATSWSIWRQELLKW